MRIGCGGISASGNRRPRRRRVWQGRRAIPHTDTPALAASGGGKSGPGNSAQGYDGRQTTTEVIERWRRKRRGKGTGCCWCSAMWRRNTMPSLTAGTTRNTSRNGCPSPGCWMRRAIRRCRAGPSIWPATSWIPAKPGIRRSGSGGCGNLRSGRSGCRPASSARSTFATCTGGCIRRSWGRRRRRRGCRRSFWWGGCRCRRRWRTSSTRRTTTKGCRCAPPYPATSARGGSRR